MTLRGCTAYDTPLVRRILIEWWSICQSLRIERVMLCFGLWLSPHNGSRTMSRAYPTRTITFEAEIRAMEHSQGGFAELLVKVLEHLSAFKVVFYSSVSSSQLEIIPAKLEVCTILCGWSFVAVICNYKAYARVWCTNRCLGSARLTFIRTDG